jgi:hypothetical protein
MTYPTSNIYYSTGDMAGNNPEIAVSLSGGGFSSYFPQPSYHWQVKTVATFLQTSATRTTSSFTTIVTLPYATYCYFVFV